MAPVACSTFLVSWLRIHAAHTVEPAKMASESTPTRITFQ